MPGNQMKNGDFFRDFLRKMGSGAVQNDEMCLSGAIPHTKGLGEI